MRLPRGHRSHSWRSCVRRFSSRIARSRYFSRISSSVAGIRRGEFDGAEPCPLACIKRCSKSSGSDEVFTSRSAPARAPPCLEELQRLQVDEALALAQDVRVPKALEELLGALEVAHPDLDAAKALHDVAVRSGPCDDAVLGGEADRLLVEGRDRDAG